MWCSDACRIATNRRSEPITEQVNSEQSNNEQPIPNKPELTAQGNIRVSKPGDDDYEPQCETTRAFIEGRDKRPETAKRGKDIKCFADLPPDVQETIDSLSQVDGKICQRVKANRTAIAINYQHLFPDSYGLGAIELMRAEADYPGDDHSTGVICSGPVVTGKSGDTIQQE